MQVKSKRKELVYQSCTDMIGSEVLIECLLYGNKYDILCE